MSMQPGTWAVMRRLLGMGRSYAPLAAGVVLASLVYDIATAFLIWFLGNAIFSGSIPVDRLPGSLRAALGPLAGPGLPLRTVLLWGCSATALAVLAAYLRQLGSGRVVWRIVANLRQALCDRFLSLDLGFYQHRKSGDLLSRINHDVTNAQTAILFLFQELLQRPISVATGVWILWGIDAKLTAGSLLVLPLVVLPLRAISQRIRQAAQRGAETLGDITQAIQQILAGIRVVKAFGAEAREREAFAEVNGRFTRKMMSIVRARALSSSLMDLVGYGAFATGGVVLLGWLSRQGTLSIPEPKDLVIFMLLGVQKVFAPVRELVKALNVLQASLPGTARVLELLDAEPAGQDSAGAPALAPLGNEISFEGVTFAYLGNGGAPVLRDVTLRVRKGWLVAVVGPSGAGKTTLLSLLPRFYDPQQGRVAMDGVDVRAVTRASLLAQMAVVGQDPFLFHTTLRENIAYGRPSATGAEVEAAARAANIHDVIAALPQGYDTSVGERGLRLSGGERQRVAIARALLKDAAILILDEATSELDSASERAVQEALDRLMAGRTTLVIAHRLSTVLHADRIVVLEAGRIAEEGTHGELLARGGLYRRLYEMQFAGAGAEGRARA